MKKLSYRLLSSRSFAQFSMHTQLEERRTTMACKKFFLRLLFVALATLLAERAKAQDVPPWDLGGFDFSWDGTWGSTISCTKPTGADATNVVDPTFVRQTASVSCTIKESPTDPGVTGTCTLDIKY